MIDIEKTKQLFPDDGSSYVRQSLHSALDELQAARETIKKYDLDLAKCSINWIKEQLIVARQAEELELLRAIEDAACIVAIDAENGDIDEDGNSSIAHVHHEALEHLDEALDKAKKWRAKQGEKG